MAERVEGWWGVGRGARQVLGACIFVVVNDINWVFLMIIKSKNIYSVSHENSKTNYEKLTILINDFLKKYDLKINEISKLYVNRGPGSFAGIRNSFAVVKAIYVVKKIDYYCFSFNDFDKSNNNKYENIPNLCNKLKIKKNLINPIYLS